MKRILIFNFCFLILSCCRIMAFPLTNDNDSILQKYEQLIAIDSAANNFSAAYEHLKEKEKQRQILLSIHQDKILNDSALYQPITALFLQIVNMEKELKKTQESVRFRMQMIIGMSGVVCLLLVVVFVQIYRLRKNRRTNNTLFIENNQNQQLIEDLSRLVENYDAEIQHLVQDNDRLETTNAVKDKLLSVISHDLRSPISSLQALLTLFKTNSIARIDLVDFFGKLLSRADNTSTMLENLLHWSQYQLKGIDPIYNKVDLQKIIDECINLYRMQAEQKHIVIDNSLKTNVYVSADVEMLKVILRNLISNALKFTHSGGIITIITMTKANQAVVSVKDTGIGISPENQVRMFAMDNFTTPGTEKEKGTGLGLMLCKDFVEHNHGTLWLDSQLNVGTTFHFSIPIL